MKNLILISALIFGFTGLIEASQSKAESEVATAFKKYFDARVNQDWDTVAAMERDSGNSEEKTAEIQ